MKKFIDKTTSELLMLDNILKYAPDWIYWKDVNSIHLGCSELFSKVAGFKNREEMIGKSDYECAWGNRAEKYNLDDAEVIRSGKPKLNIEDTVLLNDGREITVISNKVPLRNSDGQIIGILGIATDITNRKNMEEDLRQAKEAAEAANHAKTEFIANMGHDIRTPLTGIIGMSHILENEVQHASEKEHATIIHQSGEQLLGLLNGVLDLITVDATNEDMVLHESFDVRRVILDVIELEQSAVEAKHLKIETHVDEAIPPFLISDKMKLHRIILNLVGNAIKFTQEGHIEINAQLQSIEDNGAKIIFSVKDTGVGIPDELQDKVFDRFFKVSPSYKGLYTGNGIGLHIAQKYVDLMGGDIQLESTLGVGTTFSFTVSMNIGQTPEHEEHTAPIEFLKAASPAPLERDELKPPTQPSLNTNPNLYQVLLVEDNAPALYVLNMMMKPFDAQISTAIDAEDALDLVKSHSFDLIITDLGLPGQSGDEMTLLIRALEHEHHLKPATIIGLTGHALGEITKQCLDAGMNEVYRKPMRPEVLKNLMDKLMVPKQKPESFAKEAPSISGLGMDLPNTERQLFEMNEYPIVDMNVAIKLLGNEEMVRTIFFSLKDQGITADLAIIKKAHETGDWVTIEHYTHKIKGGACYGTVRLYHALLYMERYLKAGHTHCAEELYVQMLRVIDETLVYLDKL
jgi:two-component system, OmpR family, aerobic respiration control sensor histidine kinase ArcB